VTNTEVNFSCSFNCCISTGGTSTYKEPQLAPSRNCCTTEYFFDLDDSIDDDFLESNDEDEEEDEYDGYLLLFCLCLSFEADLN